MNIYIQTTLLQFQKKEEHYLLSNELKTEFLYEKYEESVSCFIKSTFYLLCSRFVTISIVSENELNVFNCNYVGYVMMLPGFRRFDITIFRKILHFCIRF